MSDAPQVFSRSVSFEFNSRTARNEISRIAPAVKRHPLLRTPTVVAPLLGLTSSLNIMGASISSRHHPSSVLPLHGLAVRSIPDGVRGALVRRVSAQPDGPLDVTWLAAETPRLALSRIRLHWQPSSLGGWGVTAHLGLATGEVHLASWPAAPDAWPHLVHRTVHEVTGLCAALTFAADALDLSNRLAEV
ncbi:hypothetical protein [Streptomyces sp. ALB3]|uniref:hypothetical protein n=1 Tax=Streptomyces sp. ALB3 TaxID=3374278 RepID=UPI0037A179EB